MIRLRHPLAPARRVSGKEAGPGWLVLPLILIIVIPIAEYLLGPDVYIRQSLLVAPALTAIVAGPLITAGMCVLALISVVISAFVPPAVPMHNFVSEVVTQLVISGVLVLFCYLRDMRELELMRIRDVSYQAQRVVLRPLPARAGPLSIGSAYRAAQAHVHVGGDLYAVARTSCSTRLVIGDVKGHGLDSISDTATLLGAFRAMAHREPSLPDLCDYLDGATRWSLEQLGGTESTERFITVLMAEIPDDEPVVHLINCGHPPPLRLCGRTATPLCVPDPAPPLGLALTPSWPYAPTTFPFALGDTLLLYTDGVTETRNREGAFYPLTERVVTWAGESPADLVRDLTDDLLAYAGGTINDDMAVIAAARERAPARVGTAPSHHDPWEVARPA